MIKKSLHFICFAVGSILWSVLLGLLYQQLFVMILKINILAPRTYSMLIDFWNGGGVLKGKDLTLILAVLSYFPLCFYGVYRLYHYKFMKLIIGPLTWFSNLGLGKYQNGAPIVNIKNLKIEEKKTIEQIVQERIEQEKKKNPQTGTTDFRKKIIERIENETK